jgi:AraC-like DNA-binding protein
MAHLDRVIEANYANSGFTMEDMAKEFNMSRASFYRKINGVLDMSPNDYLRFVRLKKAAQLFRQDAVRVNEACYLVGFNSPSYFAKCFQKQFGISPKDFLEKNLQEAGKKH